MFLFWIKYYFSSIVSSTVLFISVNELEYKHEMGVKYSDGRIAKVSSNKVKTKKMHWKCDEDN